MLHVNAETKGRRWKGMVTRAMSCRHGKRERSRADCRRRISWRILRTVSESRTRCAPRRCEDFGQLWHVSPNNITMIVLNNITERLAIN
jgi:hypothetical protein